MELVSDIATELAKKNIKFKEEDKNDQDKLQLLFLKSKENKETIERRIQFLIADLKEKNPNVAINEEDVRNDILVNIQKSVQSGTIGSIEDLQSPQFIGKITNSAQQTVSNKSIEILNDNNDNIYDNEEENIDQEMFLISTELISKLRDGSLTQKEIENIENEHENSEVVKKQETKNEETLLDENASEEEQMEAATEIATSNLKSNDYFLKTKNDNADRGKIIAIARLAVSGNERAILLAAIYGFNDTIKEDGTIDMDLLQEKMRIAVKGDARLEEMYGQDGFLRDKAIEINERCAKKTIDERNLRTSYRERLKKATSPEEKNKIVEELIAEEKRERETIKKIAMLKSEGNYPEATKLIISLIGSERKGMEETLIRFAEFDEQKELSNAIKAKVKDGFNNKSKEQYNFYKKSDIESETER